ncbi:MAG: hypothetical protein K1X35_06090 [Caulobacteraceae bacterium]|nr:hypothetical protein [Caulobacteraceae bacterium]
MKIVLYILAAALLGGGLFLIVTDFPAIEARFPSAGPTFIGVGLMVFLATFYIGRKDL